jgi:hypothetical protein
LPKRIVGGNSNVGNGLMINNTSTTNNTYAPLDFKCGTNHVWGRLAYKATDTNDAFGQFEFITMDDGSAVQVGDILEFGDASNVPSTDGAPSGFFYKITAISTHVLTIARFNPATGITLVRSFSVTRTPGDT